MEQWATNLQQNSFNGIDNIKIAYCVMLQPAPSDAMIIVNGRSESYLKYQEVANDFYQRGYSVYMLDHRGQGLSGRLLDNKDKGYVTDFDEYVNDLSTFIKQVVVLNKHQRYILAGHSMGGAIVARYLQKGSHPINRAILSSPMFGLLMPAPLPIVKFVSHGVNWLDRVLGREPSYVVGTRTYESKPFLDNDLMQSATRYAKFRQVYADNPNIQLGGPTYPWLTQALQASELCVADADKITIPILLLQSGADSIVDNQAQLLFESRANDDIVRRQLIRGARHELFFEHDQYRQQTLTAIDQFLEH